MLACICKYVHTYIHVGQAYTHQAVAYIHTHRRSFVYRYTNVDLEYVTARRRDCGRRCVAATSRQCSAAAAEAVGRQSYLQSHFAVDFT